MRGSLLSIFAAFALLARAHAQEPGFDDVARSEQRAAAAAAATEPLYDLHYDLKGRIRDVKIDADLWASGRLLMRGRAASGGQLSMSLVRPLIHPYRFLWINPAFLPQNASCGSVVTVAAPTWPARKAADDGALQVAHEVHDQWAAQWGGKRALDSGFDFIVIGAPEGRFQVDVSQAGRVQSVVNRMTGRWLPNGWEDWMKGKPQEGYAFWSNGDSPPNFDPHCYDGFAAAMKLLSRDAFKGGSLGQTFSLGQGGRYNVQYGSAPQSAENVCEALVPYVKGRVSISGDATLSFSVAELTPAAVTVSASSGKLAAQGDSGYEYSVSRRLTYDRQASRVESDDCRIELRDDAGNTLDIDVGYEPHR